MRWYMAYSISYRQLEEMMEERGIKDRPFGSQLRWVIKYVPLQDRAFCARKRRVGGSWRMDETYVRIGDRWKCLCRTVDKIGTTVAFLLTAKPYRKAAVRFLCKAIGRHDTPAKITIDRGDPNAAALRGGA